MKKTSNIVGLLLLALPAFSQKTVTPDEAVAAVLKNHPTIRAASSDVQAKRYLEKAAFNLPNPELNAESPTGEFYAIGVLQSFEFPTVYARQKQVAKAETGLAQAGQRVSENDLRYSVRLLYLEAQVAEYQSRQWAGRDSLYAAISTAAIRQFVAGEIDFLQKTLTENEAGKVHQERLAAEQTLVLLRQQLATFTGLADLGVLVPLAPDTVRWVAANDLTVNPAIAYAQQAVQVAERQAALAKSRALPNFSLGYLNQGPRSTTIDYRFRASIGIPLWAGQSRAGRQAAESQSQAVQSRAEGQVQAVALEMQRAQSKLMLARAAVQYFEREALPRSQALITAALRLREAGQTDYVTFLRTLDAAFQVQREYSEQVEALETAKLRGLYLAGQ